MKQIPLAIGNDEPHRFDHFLAGANAPALAHLRALESGAPPVYLWGPSGSGKTHLLEAAAVRAAERGGGAGWFGAGDPAPWAMSEAWSLVLFDDCDRFDPDQQQAAFRLFVEATARALPVVAAGRVPPVDLPLREDLRSRLGWGHVFALQPLAETEARAALRQEADRRGVFLSDDVIDFLLTRFERDLKHLMAQLARLDAFAMASKRALTVPLLKQMLADEAGA
jgi:DnaA family protein